MMWADGLLVLQARNCDDQIRAKVYEYLRYRRPIIALTDHAGDTANLLRRGGVNNSARLDSAEEIASELRRFPDEIQRGTPAVPDDTLVAGASRLNRTRELVDVIDRLGRSLRTHRTRT